MSKVYRNIGGSIVSGALPGEEFTDLAEQYDEAALLEAGLIEIVAEQDENDEAKASEKASK